MKRLIILTTAMFLLIINQLRAEDEIIWSKARTDLGLEWIINAVFSPDDSKVIITDANGKVIEVDPSTGELIRERPEFHGLIKFSDDGKYVFTHDYKKVDYETGEVIGQCLLNGEPLETFTEMDISDKAGLLIGIYRAKTQFPLDWGKMIYIFDLNTFELIDTLGIEYNNFRKIAFIDDGRHFRTVSDYDVDPSKTFEDKVVTMVWDAKTLDTLYEKPDLYGTLSYSPDGKWLASINENIILLFDSESLTKVNELIYTPSKSTIKNLDFSHDSQYLLTGPHNDSSPEKPFQNSIVIFDVLSGNEELVYKYNWMDDFVFNKLVYSSKGDYILAYHRDHFYLLNDLLSSVMNPLNDDYVAIYPNPTTGLISIDSQQLELGKLKIELCDFNGKLKEILFDDFYKGNPLSFDISRLPGGVYFLNIIQENSTQTYKIIKEK